jgi:hypothetical protein
MSSCALSVACKARASNTVKRKRTKEVSAVSHHTIGKDEASKDPSAIMRVVERNIQRFFGNDMVPAAAIDVVVDDEGYNMRDRMYKDRVALLDEGKRRAVPDYFMEVKKKYVQLLTGVMAVSVNSTSAVVPSALAHALAQARGKYRRGRKRDPIVHYLWSCRVAPNQTSVIDIVNFIIEAQEANNIQQAMLVTELFKHFLRLDMMQVFKLELAPAMRVLEESLRTIFAHESRTAVDYDFSVFWQKYNVCAKLFVKQELVDQVLTEKHDVSKCLGPLSALATGSTLGADMFLPSCPVVVGAHVNGEMLKIAAELGNVALVDSNMISTTVVAMVAVAERLHFDTLVGPHEATYKFMNVEIKLMTHTAIEQARLHVASVVRTLAVQRGQCEQLQVLKEVHPIKVTRDASKQIDDTVLAMYRPAQHAVSAEMRRETYTSAEAVVKHLEELRSVWWSHDPTMVLEIALLKALSGRTGATMLMDQALDFLPQGIEVLPYSTVRGYLLALETTKAWLFASAPARNRVIAIIDIIGGMERGEGPLVTQFPTEAQMQRASTLLSNFIHHEAAASSTQAGAVTFGLVALKLHIAQLEMVVQDKTITELTLVTKCQTFAWLLDEAEGLELDDLAAQAYAIVVGKVSAVSATAVGGAMDVMVAAAHSAKATKANKKLVPQSSASGKVAKKTKGKK